MNEQTETKQTSGDVFWKSAICKNSHSLPTWNLTWCDLNIKVNFPKYRRCDLIPHEKYRNKLLIHQLNFNWKEQDLKIHRKKFFKYSQNALVSFLKRAVITLAQVIGVDVGAKSEKHQVWQAPTNNLKSRSRGEMLSWIKRWTWR